MLAPGSTSVGTDVAPTTSSIKPDNLKAKKPFSGRSVVAGLGKKIIKLVIETSRSEPASKKLIHRKTEKLKEPTDGCKALAMGREELIQHLEANLVKINKIEEKIFTVNQTIRRNKETLKLIKRSSSSSKHANRDFHNSIKESYKKNEEIRSELIKEMNDLKHSIQETMASKLEEIKSSVHEKFNHLANSNAELKQLEHKLGTVNEIIEQEELYIEVLSIIKPDEQLVKQAEDDRNKAIENKNELNNKIEHLRNNIEKEQELLNSVNDWLNAISKSKLSKAAKIQNHKVPPPNRGIPV